MIVLSHILFIFNVKVWGGSVALVSHPPSCSTSPPSIRSHPGQLHHLHHHHHFLNNHIILWSIWLLVKPLGRWPRQVYIFFFFIFVLWISLSILQQLQPVWSTFLYFHLIVIQFLHLYIFFLIFRAFARKLKKWENLLPNTQTISSPPLHHHSHQSHHSRSFTSVTTSRWGSSTSFRGIKRRLSDTTN